MLEQVIADWLRKAWLKDHPEASEYQDWQWPMLAARDLASHIRARFALKKLP